MNLKPIEFALAALILFVMASVLLYMGSIAGIILYSVAAVIFAMGAIATRLDNILIELQHQTNKPKETYHGPSYD